MSSKVAIILRGVPGSGKSTFVNLIKQSSKKTVVHAIDDLHRDDNGKYLWHEEHADKFYTVNFANFVVSCNNGEPVVICDAINIEVEDFQKYVDIAEQCGYAVYVVTPNPPKPSESTKRNKHHTSSLQAKEMYKRWENWPTFEMLEERINENS